MTDRVTNPEDYEVAIRDITTEYTSTLPRDVDEQIDPKTTVSLETITVAVSLEWHRRRNRQSETLAITFRTDYDRGIATAKDVGDAYGDTDDLSMDRLLVGIRAAEEAVVELLGQLHTPLGIYPISERYPLASVTESAIDITNDETALAREVADD